MTRYLLGESQAPSLYFRLASTDMRGLRSGPMGLLNSAITRRLDREPISVGGSSMPNVISVTPDNIETELAGLPRLVRLALGFGARLRRGCLQPSGAPSAQSMA